ncbi:hypothetical protein Gotur_024986 [Gossypium turneri]
MAYNSSALAIQRQEAFIMLDGSFMIKANRKIEFAGWVGFAYVKEVICMATFRLYSSSLTAYYSVMCRIDIIWCVGMGECFNPTWCDEMVGDGMERMGTYKIVQQRVKAKRDSRVRADSSNLVGCTVVWRQYPLTTTTSSRLLFFHIKSSSTHSCLSSPFHHGLYILRALRTRGSPKPLKGSKVSFVVVFAALVFTLVALPVAVQAQSSALAPAPTSDSLFFPSLCFSF